MCSNIPTPLSCLNACPSGQARSQLGEIPLLSGRHRSAFVTANNPFAVQTPSNDEPMEGAMSWEPDSIDADADGLVQAVWSTPRRVGAVSRTGRKGLGPPLQRSILGAIARRRHAFWALCQEARGPHQSAALDRYIAARFRVKNMVRTSRRRQKARAK
jgi:hypothetical protein